ncbi:MAG: PAS domain-containing protein [Rhizobiales bacterium]|nr:PAS domain-containing protein [Hyphomicrobiales bacterium]
MAEFCELVDLASDAALAISSESRVVAWNERAASLLGYAPEQTLGRPCYDILQAVLPSGEPLCTPECEGKLCFVRHSPFAVRECSLRHKDGRWLRASLSTLVAPTPDRDEADSPTVAVVFLQPREEPVSGPSADRQLRVFTFGHFGLSVADRGLPIDRWYRKHALTLLKLLVTHRGEAVHREHVIECLWSDADERRGRERLKVTTYFLRQQMRAAGVGDDVVTVADATYALRRAAVWLDCEVFESLFNEGRLLKQRGRPKDALLCFEKAERIYKGDYLPEERYADWCAEERERLREIYLDVLGHMVDGYFESGDHERAAQVCRLALSREPCREGFHRTLMICLTRLGQRDRAVAHYHRCRQVLKAELGVEPAPETERLYRELFSAA